MANTKDIVVGSIQFSPGWEKFFDVNQKINDRVALKMYKALKAVANNPDRKALKRVHKALEEYEQSYNKNY